MVYKTYALFLYSAIVVLVAPLFWTTMGISAFALYYGYGMHGLSAFLAAYGAHVVGMVVYFLWDLSGWALRMVYRRRRCV